MRITCSNPQYDLVEDVEVWIDKTRPKLRGAAQELLDKGGLNERLQAHLKEIVALPPPKEDEE
jgi:hypothetical protein